MRWIALCTAVFPLLSCAETLPQLMDAGPVALPSAASATEPPLAPWTQAEMALPQVADGAHFAVATAHPLATRAARDVLEKGGTAVDALIAASFVLTVVAPQSTGIGGGGFAIVFPGDARPARAFDFRETAPHATQRSDYLTADGKAIAERSQHHGLAVATPGYVAGLWRLHRRYGSLPWASLVQPAVVTARRGFPVGRDLARSIALVQTFLNAPAKRVFLRDGAPLQAGDVLVQPALARTLQRIADVGPSAFYAGDMAADIVATAQAAGGKLNLDDLMQYDTRDFAPLTGRVAGLEVLTMPQPSAGGAQVLAMAEAFGGLPADQRNGKDVDKLAHVLAEVMRRSFVLRLTYTGDVAKPAQSLDQAFPDAARKALNQTLDSKRATSTDKLPPLAPGAVGETHANTSHVAIVDANGMAISSTHTVNLYLGSGLVTEGGIVLNNEMDDFTFSMDASNFFGLAGSEQNLARPGARPVSSMSPSILLQDGQPVLVVGSPGGTRIPTTVFQVLARHLFLMQPLDQAVAAVRVHHQAKPDSVWVEEGPLGDALVGGLQKRGHVVTRAPQWCNVQAVRRTCDKLKKCTVQAVSDPRQEGGAAAK